MGGLVSDGWFSARYAVYFQMVGLVSDGWFSLDGWFVSDGWFSFRWLV